MKLLFDQNLSPKLVNRLADLTPVAKREFRTANPRVGGTKGACPRLELLERFARRVPMYVHPVEVSTVQSYLHGLDAGCSLAGLSMSRELYRQAAKSRGWRWRAGGIVWHMRMKKLDDATIMQELIAVEAEAFRLAAAQGA